MGTPQGLVEGSGVREQGREGQHTGDLLTSGPQAPHNYKSSLKHIQTHTMPMLANFLFIYVFLHFADVGKKKKKRGSKGNLL